jgi:hypothetical protein
MLKSWRERETELTNPHLGAELLKSPKGPLPLEVFMRYLYEQMEADEQMQTDEQIHRYLHLMKWCIDPFHPAVVALAPQEAVDIGWLKLQKVIDHLESGSLAAAREAAERVEDILFRGLTIYRRSAGQPPTMRPMAVRAFVIQKFNPDPARPGESTVTFAQIADMLFLKDGKCPRFIRDVEANCTKGKRAASKHPMRKCGVEHHSHDDACVEDLRQAVYRLRAAMKNRGFSV